MSVAEKLRSCTAPDAGHRLWIPVAGCSFTVLLGMNGFRTQTRSMSDEEKKMSFEIWCDLLETELKRALEDLSVIRGLDKAQAKSKSHMLRAALNNAQHYFREIQDSLR